MTQNSNEQVVNCKHLDHFETNCPYNFCRHSDHCDSRCPHPRSIYVKRPTPREEPPGERGVAQTFKPLTQMAAVSPKSSKSWIHFGDGRSSGGTTCSKVVDGWHWTLDLLSVTCPDCQDLLKDAITKERDAQTAFRKRMGWT